MPDPTDHRGHSYSVSDVLRALHAVCKGRVVLGAGELLHETNPDVVTKTSHIPGKAVTELPGLLYGHFDQDVNTIGLAMTLTENVIELAGELGMDAVVVHHPVADAASSGGVLVKDYLALYDLALFEAHEAFHGTHPGVAFLHGFSATSIYTHFSGTPGVNVYVGETLPEISTVGDICERLNRLMGLEDEKRLLSTERQVRATPDLRETLVAQPPDLLVGDEGDPATVVAQFAPHSGFNAGMLEEVLERHPNVDTLIAAKGRLRSSSHLVNAARSFGLSLLNGNTHGWEIFENWMPLAAALRELLPGVAVEILRERVTAVPYESAGAAETRRYAQKMAEEHLLAGDLARTLLRGRERSE